MALFKSEEEKLREEQEEIKYWEDEILKKRIYNGKVGHIHQGLSYAGLWGVRNNGKVKYKSSKFEIHDTRLLIERNKTIIEFSNIKEIFHETDNEAIILLNNDNGIPIKSSTNATPVIRRFKAFINILNRLVEENKDTSNVSNEDNNMNSANSEDKFDKLIKLGEMHDKGLLSDEEFASLKQELLSGNDETASNQSEENDAEISENVCENCGTEIAEDSIFCAECGTKIR